MAWKVELTPEIKLSLKKLGHVEAQRIIRFLRRRVQNRDDPREIGGPLTGGLRDYWRYRVGDYRIICRLEDEYVTVIVIRVGHRREIYKKP